MYLHLSCVMLSLERDNDLQCSVLSMFAYTSFVPMVPFHHRHQFSPFCGRTKIRDTYRLKKERHPPPIFTHQSSPTNFHPPLWPTHVPNTHSNSPVWFYPPILTHTFSPTNFAHLFPPTFFRPLFLHPHWFLAPAVPQKSIFTHDSLPVRSGFTHLQISSNCRFHPLADFTYL